MKLLAGIGLLVTLANANPLRRDRRSIEEFHAQFMGEQQALVYARSACTPQQYYDFELETCKDCEKHCPANLCGQCRVYYGQKSSTETEESMEGMLFRNEIVDAIQSALIVVLLVAFCYAVKYFKDEIKKKNSTVTVDPNPHDKDQLTEKDIEATVKKNKIASERNSRADNETATRQSGRSYQCASSGHQETTNGRDGQSAKVVGEVEH